MVLLCSEGGERERLAVVGVGVALQRDLVGDHAPPHHLVVAFGKVGQDDLPHRCDVGAPIIGQLGQILLNSVRVAAHHDGQTRGSGHLEESGGAHAPADAHGDDPVPPTRSLQVPEELAHHP